MKQEQCLLGQVALVTGGSRGIGKSIAYSLAKNGATVIATATTQSGADLISAAYKDMQLDGQGLVLDVSSLDSLSSFLRQIKQTVGMPDILVNNAAITRDNLLLRMKNSEWDEVIETNLTSVYRIVQACLRNMLKKRYGRIINISSVVGATGNIGQVNYSAAKAGVEAFTRSLAQEVGSRNITVNAIAPGFIDTDMTNSLNEQVKNEILQKIPLQRMGMPEDIANAVLFLVSNDANYITGQTLHINGGMYMP